MTFQPRPVRIDLLVQDSRGDVSVSQSISQSAQGSPEVFDLTVSVLRVEDEVPTEVTTTVRVQDADGTTDTVRGELISGGKSVSMYFYDDGTNGDSVEGDDIWTSRFSWVVTGGNWARVEVFAIDGELVSPAQVHTVPIVESESGGLDAWISSFGIPVLLVAIVSLSVAGLALLMGENGGNSKGHGGNRVLVILRSQGIRRGVRLRGLTLRPPRRPFPVDPQSLGK